MPNLRVEIVRFTDNWQPGWVECRFEDIHGAVYTFEEKVPLVTDEYLDAGSDYPRPGVVGCSILARSGDMIRVAVEPINDSFECDVLASELVVESASGSADP